MGTIDYEEMVELRIGDEVHQQPLEHLQEMRSGRQIMPLWRAVRRVIVDWAPVPRRQMGAQIIRNSGASLMDLGAIQAVYDQDDFPAKRDRGRAG